MLTLQSIKYNRIEAIIKSVGIEASERDILMLVAEIPELPQNICAAHIIPKLFALKNEVIKASVKREQDTLEQVKGIMQRSEGDRKCIKELHRDLQGTVESLNQANKERNQREHKYNNLVKHTDSLKNQLTRERMANTMRITAIQELESQLKEARESNDSKYIDHINMLTLDMVGLVKQNSIIKEDFFKVQKAAAKIHDTNTKLIKENKEMQAHVVNAAIINRNLTDEKQDLLDFIRNNI